MRSKLLLGGDAVLRYLITSTHQLAIPPKEEGWAENPYEKYG